MRLSTKNTGVVIGAHLGLLCLFVLTGAATEPDHRRMPTTAPVPARLAGRRTCYSLTFSETFRYFTTPERVELVDSVARFWLRGETWRYATARPERAASIARWSTAGPDSITVLLDQGAVGIVMRVSSTHDTLVGRAWTYTDSWPLWEGPDAIVRWAPISCLRPAARRAPSARS